MRSQLALSFLALVNIAAIGLASLGSAPRALPWALLLLQIALATKLMSRTGSSPVRSSAEHPSSAVDDAGDSTPRDHSARRARRFVATLMISTVATGLLLWLVMVVGWIERFDHPAFWGDQASALGDTNREERER